MNVDPVVLSLLGTIGATLLGTIGALWKINRRHEKLIEENWRACERDNREMTVMLVSVVNTILKGDMRKLRELADSIQEHLESPRKRQSDPPPINSGD